MNFKCFLFVYLALSLFNQNISFASGGVGGTEGGGSPCVFKIDTVRAELLKWIQSGIAENKLKLNPGWSYYGSPTTRSYYSEMKNILADYEVVLSCKNSKKDKSAILVDGEEKMCKNFTDKNGRPHIECDYRQIMSTDLSQKDLFQTIHHEFASLAGLEYKNGSAFSDMSISEQIDQFGHFEAVWKLGRINDLSNLLRIDTEVNISTQNGSMNHLVMIESYFDKSNKPVLGRMVLKNIEARNKLNSKGGESQFRSRSFSGDSILGYKTNYYFESADDFQNCSLTKSNSVIFKKSFMKDVLEFILGNKKDFTNILENNEKQVSAPYKFIVTNSSVYIKESGREVVNSGFDESSCFRLKSFVESRHSR